MMSLQTQILGAALCGLWALVGCEREQLLVSIDTDAPRDSEVAGSQRLSSDAIIDSARIEILGPGGEVLDVCERHPDGSSGWPLTLGVAPATAERTLRVRLFRRSLVTTAPAAGVARLCGVALGNQQAPALSVIPPEIAVDRLVRLPPSDGGVVSVHLDLRLSCLGLPASVLEQRSCIDGAQPALLAVPAGDPRHLDATPPGGRPRPISRLAQAGDCPLAVPTGTVCVPGGMLLMGDPNLQVPDPYLTPRPLRAVRVSTFFMDRVEFSVGRMKATLTAAAAHSPPVPLAPPLSSAAFAADDPFGPNCTWKLVGGNDQLPVNCISAEAARAVCQFLGGDLPSEAQWEHAARGRGQRWSFPWGEFRPNQSARCCKSATSRSLLQLKPPGFVPDPVNRCVNYGPASVGNYDGTDGCPEGGDVSRDGVLDLGGNVSEFTRDAMRAYDDRCGLTGPVTLDPTCADGTNYLRAVRGGNWLFTPDTYALSAWRRLPPRSPLKDDSRVVLDALTGFRCVFEVKP